MRFNQDKDYSSYSIHTYKQGEVSIYLPIMDFSVKDQELQKDIVTKSFIMTPRALIKDWPPTSLAELTSDHLNTVGRLNPELIILGTGQKLSFPETAITAKIIQSGIGVEIMDNSAACRTYNILMHEGRNVAMAIIL